MSDSDKIHSPEEEGNHNDAINGNQVELGTHFESCILSSCFCLSCRPIYIIPLLLLCLAPFLWTEHAR